MALPDTYRPSPHCPSLAPCCQRVGKRVCVCTYYRRANAHNQNVNDRQDDLAGRRKVPTPVEVQPVHTTKTDCTRVSHCQLPSKPKITYN